MSVTSSAGIGSIKRGYAVAVAVSVLALAGCAPAREPATPAATASPRASSPAWPLLPLPARIEPADGEFVLSPATRIRVAADDAAAAQAAGYFAGLLQRTRGMAPAIEAAPGGPGGPGDIVFATDAAAPAGAEAYALEVTPQGIRVRARQPAGLFYGGISLWQLLTPDAAQGFPIRVPSVRITDEPRFGWRGLMVDSARHFRSTDEIKQILDWMAQHKLNVLHWHLTDDQGWRLQIKRYPKLTQVGAWRVPPGAGAQDDAGRPRRYGGFYTQDQAREIVAYARARQITVVPEIEMPGHAQAAIAAYPALGVNGQAPPVSSGWGVHPYLFNVEEGTFTFLENVLTEVMDIFPGSYLHIGGDEAVKQQWQQSARVQQRMRELGIADAHGLQSWFITRIEKFLSAHGRRLVGWDEILEGGLPPAATVMSWRGNDGAIIAARAGHDVILTPGDPVYLNNRQSEAQDEPAGHGALITLDKVQAFEPVPAELDAQQAKHVLGAQANLWGEYMRTFADLQHMAFPRLAALAEAVWSPKAARERSGFLTRLAPQLQRYRRLGIGYADSAFAVRAALAPGDDARHLHVRLSTQTGFGQIRYSTDGSEPTPSSAQYRQTLTLPLATALKAASFNGGARLSRTRSYTLDAAVLRRRDNAELALCDGSNGWRFEDDAPYDGPRAVFRGNLLGACYLWRQADLAGIGGVRVRVGSIPYNFMGVGDPAQAKAPKAATPSGELQVRRDRCDGELLASLSLAPARRNAALTTLQGPLRGAAGKASGQHDLCLLFTGIPDPVWAIDRIELLPGTQR